MDGTNGTTCEKTDAQPRAALKTAINRYYKQLMEGCGRVSCPNGNCASSGKLPKLTSNEAAARAISCLLEKTPLCDPLPVPEQVESITEEHVNKLLQECRSTGNWSSMIRYVEHVFSTPDVLLRSFVMPYFSDKITKSNEPTVDINGGGAAQQFGQCATTDTQQQQQQQPGAPRKRRALECEAHTQQHGNCSQHHHHQNTEMEQSNNQNEGVPGTNTTTATNDNITSSSSSVTSGTGSGSGSHPVPSSSSSSSSTSMTSKRCVSAVHQAHTPATGSQSGSAIDSSGTARSTHAHTLSTARSTSLTRSASDLGTTATAQHASSATAASQRSDHCSDCGWRNIVVEDKDAQTESVLDTANSKEASADKTDDDKSSKCGEHESALSAIRSGKCPTDMEAARRCFNAMFGDSNDHENYAQAAMGAIARLCNLVDFQLQCKDAWARNPIGMVHLLNLIFELPFVQWFEFINVGLMPLCKMCIYLGREGQMAVASVWAEFEPKWLQDRIGILQQAMTLRILTVIDSVGSLPRFTDRIEAIPTTVQTLSIFYKAVLIKAKRTTEIELKSQEYLHVNDDQDKQVPSDAMDTSEDLAANTTGGAAATANEQSTQHLSTFLSALQTHEPSVYDEEEERLARMAGIDAWEVSGTCIPLSEFINDTLSENFSVEDDFVAYKSSHNGHAFSVMPEYSFVLSLEVRQKFLIICNRIRQRSERRHTLATAIAYGLMLEPYLRLTIRRDNVVRDALDGLAAAAFDDVSNFRKQLSVHFDGEQAIDEGGVSKEFYQLIIEQLFCPEYGMFVANEKTGLYWFNAQCTFCDDEYGLIGLLFGLAIYNNVLVDVRFPTALYTKLLARPAQFDELAQLDPDLHRGLKELLACEEDVENTYCYTFEISYKDTYDNLHTKELIPNGRNIPVTAANRKEFVALYADYLLNYQIKQQFDAFNTGFSRAVNRGLLRRLCQPQEVEELVCGVLDLNFEKLSKSTRYQNGFTASSQTIQDLWTIAKEMTVEEKKMFLQFITGSDRAPVGGLAKLEIVIARNGDDKKRLPTAHTCFNVMLLPDYADLEVTRERLLKAIIHSRGFGLQ